MVYTPSYTVSGHPKRPGEARGVHDYIKERTLKIGEYIVETRNTVRTIAREFGVSKSTVHKDLTERLPEINPDLANRVKEILEYHKSIRHLRGGEATRMKYHKEDKGQKPSKNYGSRKGISSGL
jgi:putative DeoR family transcriptional regulator (stage III sporulation protein D)